MFYEIVIAPSYTPEGLEVLKGKSKNLRILEAKARGPSGTSLRQVAGGWLVQDADSLSPEAITFTCVSTAKPSEQQLQDLKFAWRCGRALDGKGGQAGGGCGREEGCGSLRSLTAVTAAGTLCRACEAVLGAARTAGGVHVTQPSHRRRKKKRALEQALTAVLACPWPSPMCSGLSST